MLPRSLARFVLAALALCVGPVGSVCLAEARPTIAISSDAELDDLMECGDAAWRRRAAGHGEDGTARPGPIAHAIECYQRALELRPDDPTVRLRLLRALFYQGEYVPADVDARREIFETGRQIFEEGVDRLAARVVGGRRELDDLSPEETAARLEGVEHAGELYFWGAVHWGLWGQYFGKMASVRQGVVKKIRHYGEIALELDPTYERGGAERLLGRMHALAPRVVFFTMWIDRDRAVELLERAFSRAPDDPLNRFFFAEALLEFAPGRRAEAERLLCQAASGPIDPERVVEDTRARLDARRAARERGLACGS